MSNLKDLITQFSGMDTQGQMEKVREIRKNKYTVKPAAAKRKRAASKKKKPMLAKLMEGMSAEEKAEILRALKDG